MVQCEYVCIKAQDVGLGHLNSVLALPQKGSVTLDRSINFSIPQCTHLNNGYYNPYLPNS